MALFGPLQIAADLLAPAVDHLFDQLVPNQIQRERQDRKVDEAV